MSKRGVYDNWQKLVEATLKRELLRELAFCPSFSSSSSFGSSSFDLSSRFGDSPFELDALSSSSSSQEVVVVGSSSSTGAIRVGQFAARLAAPAIALAHYITRKPTRKDKADVELRDIKIISLNELQVASNNFTRSNIIGRGRHGEVYKGRLTDGSLVAIKRLSRGGELHFKAEVEIARVKVHPNVLQLLAICITPTERMLVYPYMSNGTVASFLSGSSRSTLDWSKRKRIAVDSAKGLAYLNNQCGLKKIRYPNVRAYNIYLDEDFEAVVDRSELVKNHGGKIGYKTSTSPNVFGYGVMLLELITGKRAFLANDSDDDEEEKVLMLLDWVKGLHSVRKWEKIVDTKLRGNYIIQEVEQLIKVALICTRGSLHECPNMSEVVRMLEGDSDFAGWWEVWQKNTILNDFIFSEKPR